MIFRVIPIMWRAVRPSLTADMPAVVNTFWLRKGYEGLTFFGHILTPTQQEADRFNAGESGDRMSAAMKNHEMIHLRQAQSCGDSWLRFYLLYIWYWLKNKIALLHKRNRPCPLRNAAYLLNPFEIEAYARMHDLNYLKGSATEWRRYAKMSFRDRLALYHQGNVPLTSL